MTARVLALIPARGGSKRLPRKNVLPLAGKPLIAWTIEAALGCPEISRVILSSDDDEIMGVAREWGCEVPFRRPDALATDTASSMDVICHALDSLDETYDEIVLLQPTSPLRTSDDLSAAIALRRMKDVTAVVSAMRLPKPESHFARILEDGTLSRQSPFAVPAEQACLLNGAVYVADVVRMRSAGSFFDATTAVYLMPSERSVDVDTAQDFAECAALLGAPVIARA